MTVGIFLTSCGTSYSITKRQHSKGYFVSSSKKYSTPDKKEKLQENNEIAENQLAEEVVITKEIKAAQSLTSDVTETSTTSSIVKETKGSKNTVQAAVNSTSDSRTAIDSPCKAKERSNFTPLSVLKSANKNVKSTVTAMQTRATDEGLSLLWILVIVLIVLWAFGYIGGIGSSGLIHLLLVVALILLILWLLRII